MDVTQISAPTFKESSRPADTVNRGGAQRSATESGSHEKNARLHKACTDFEALILKQMLTMMRKNIPESGLMDNSPGHDMYQAMQDEQLAVKLAASGGMGLGERMYQQITGQITSSTGK